MSAPVEHVVRAADYRPRAGDLGPLVRLALPVAVVQVGMLVMGVVDTIMVGRVSAVDLAAVAIGHLYFFGVAVIGMGVLYALDPVISQSVGAGDDAGIARGVQRGFVLALALSTIGMLLLLPAAPFLRAVGQPAEIVPIAGGYAHGLIAGVFPFYGFVVLRQALQAMGHVRPIVLVVAAANLVNVLLNWVLIYGHLGSPALGAVGSAWATSASRWFMLLALLAAGWPLLRTYLRPVRADVLAGRPLWRLLRVGAPVAGQQWLEYAVFGAAGLLMGLLGAVPLASHQVALQLAALTFMVPLGVAQATSVLVGRAVGRGDPAAARRAVGAGLVTGVGFMSVTALVFLALPEPLARAFSPDPSVVEVTAILLPIAGVFQIFDGLQVVAAGALRGVADTRVPMLINLVGFWGVGLPVSAWLGLGARAGPPGIWWGLAIGIGIVGSLLAYRLRRRFGQSLERLVLDEDHV
ncbi:MAG: MATE family efflux transporter [Gemmatimonadales bacterium]